MAAVVWKCPKRDTWNVIDRVPGKKRWFKSFGRGELAQQQAEETALAINEERKAQHARMGSLRAGLPIRGEVAIPAWWAAAGGGYGECYRRTAPWMIDSFLLPHFGAVDLRRLKRDQLRNFGAAMAETEAKNGGGRRLGYHTIRNTASALRRALHWLAEDDDLEFRMPGFKIVKTVMEGAKAIGMHRGRREAWSHEEGRRLVEMARRSALGPIILAALHTGMRKGELLGLHWDDVDFAAGVIHVRRVLTSKGRIKETPKTEKSIRPVMMSEPLAAELRELSRQRIAQVALTRDPLGRVFRSRSGRPWSYDGLDQSWDRLRDRAFGQYGVRTLTFHSFRHTYVSWLLSQHVSHGWIAGQIGDSVETMVRHYAHFVPGTEGSLDVFNAQGNSAPALPAQMTAAFGAAA